MNTKFATLGALAGVVASGAAIGQANAAAMETLPSQEFSLTAEREVQILSGEVLRPLNVQSTQTLTFDLFDTAQGTLTGVKIDANFEGSSAIEAVEIFAEGGSNTDSVDANLESGLAFRIAGEGFLNFGPETSPSVSCDSFVINEETCNADDTEDFSDSGSQMSFNLSDFEGPGTFDIDIELSAFINATVIGDLFGSINGNAVTIGSVGVEYTFEPRQVEVAEPGTLALASLGLAGLAATRRRKR